MNNEYVAPTVKVVVFDAEASVMQQTSGTLDDPGYG